MATLVERCPRCTAQAVTFDIYSYKTIGARTERSSNGRGQIVQKNWDQHETFCICRHCRRSTVFFTEAVRITNVSDFGAFMIPSFQGDVTKDVRVLGHVTITSFATIKCPQDVPDLIAKTFDEAARCQAVECYSASGIMYRKCLDLATIDLISAGKDKARFERNLGSRLGHLFDNLILPQRLNSLAGCIKEDGNFAAHEGLLTKEEVEDISQFTSLLLEELFTYPAQVKRAETRREQRASAAKAG